MGVFFFPALLISVRTAHTVGRTTQAVPGTLFDFEKGTLTHSQLQGLAHPAAWLHVGEVVGVTAGGLGQPESLASTSPSV